MLIYNKAGHVHLCSPVNGIARYYSKWSWNHTRFIHDRTQRLPLRGTFAHVANYIDTYIHTVRTVGTYSTNFILAIIGYNMRNKCTKIIAKLGSS